MHPKSSVTVPDNFPRNTQLGSVSGAIPGALARKIDGKFVAGMTDEELRIRYIGCDDMLNQMVEYCHRKQKEQPDLGGIELFHRVCEILVRRQDWDFSPEEQRWMMLDLCRRMNWPTPP
jgi:hypothetical protein